MTVPTASTEPVTVTVAPIIEDKPQEPAPAPIKEFDPSTLSDDVKRYLDKERTRASQTARANALKEAVNDPTIVKTIGEKLQQEANKSVEERILEREKAISRRENKLMARDILSPCGISGEELENMLDIIVVDDAELTKAHAKTAMESILKVANASVQKTLASQMSSLNPPPKALGATSKAFKDMTYLEQLDFKKRDPSGYANAVTGVRKTL